MLFVLILTCHLYYAMLTEMSCLLTHIFDKICHGRSVQYVLLFVHLTNCAAENKE